MKHVNFFALLAMLAMISGSALAEIGFDSLPLNIQQKLNTKIPVVRWWKISPAQALADIVEKTNAAASSSAPLKISPPGVNAAWEGPPAAPIKPGGKLADQTLVPEVALYASVRGKTARELIEYVCEECALNIADFGDGMINFVPLRPSLSYFPQTVEIPKLVRANCERFSRFSWLDGIGWKRALLLQCDVSQSFAVQWLKNDTVVRLSGLPEDVWKVRRFVRQQVAQELTKQHPMTADERRFWQLFRSIPESPMVLPAPNLTLGEFVQKLRSAAGNKSAALTIHVPPALSNALPTKTVLPAGLEKADAPEMEGRPDANEKDHPAFGLRLALQNYGVELAPRNDTEVTVVSRGLYDEWSDPGAMSTWEFKFSRELLDYFNSKYEKDGPVAYPPGSIAVHSKSTGTLTVRNTWWNLHAIRYQIDCAVSEMAAQQKKSVKR